MFTKMSTILKVPIESIIKLTPETSVAIIRAILRSECSGAKLSPSVLTISERITIPDGGIDAEVNVPSDVSIPSDCIFNAGLTGFQIKSGTAFKPWTASSVHTELLNSKGNLYPEVERLVRRNGRYTIISTGYDLTPEQRNESRTLINGILNEKGFNYQEELIDVLGASQLAEFAERYPGVASMITSDPIKEAWVLDEWQKDAQLSNAFEISSEQSQIITQIQSGLQGETKHIRVLGEPGLGKTRIVLESVKNENIAPFILYFQHGTKFSQTSLFRQLIKDGYDRRLILIIDELPESEMSDLWRHLKPRCGKLKIITLDHGHDCTYDDEIDRIQIPRLSDETIKKILVSKINESREIDRWVTICEGSPRVAIAVADNLRANPDDIFKPPATVPIWDRFLHGYGKRDEAIARQVDCVAMHLALFSRFGYEAPVENEAVYVTKLIQQKDPTIGQAQFQEIVQKLRARRVLQGSRTLFFVPKALHIYLWKKYWEYYGRGFDFSEIFNTMPKSLHVWFMNMFKFAEGKATAPIINDILKVNGIFSEYDMLTSTNGSRFLSHLAEANPAAVLRLLEVTIGTWTNEVLLDFHDNRQNIVWTLEKIAVWQPFTIRAIKILARLAVNENSNNSNNSRGTLIDLFRIGPEAAVTESSPKNRLPAMLNLLRSTEKSERLLGLAAMGAALNTRGGGSRIIGPEFQGLKERAKLWIPATYGEWWQSHYLYLNSLVEETQNWPPELRSEVCSSLLNAVEQQIKIPPCTDLSFQILEGLLVDGNTSPNDLTDFFRHWREYEDDEKYKDIAKKLRQLESRYYMRNLASRFQRYVINVNYMEWDEVLRAKHNKKKFRGKALVNALALRIAQHPELFDEIRDLLTPRKGSFAISYFGEQLAIKDKSNLFLTPLIKITLNNKHDSCLFGYLSVLRKINAEYYYLIVKDLLKIEETAWIGASIILRSEYKDDLFAQCLEILEKRWIDPSLFGSLCSEKAIEAVPPEKLKRLLEQLNGYGSKDSLKLLIELLSCIPFNATLHFNSDFVLQVLSKTIPTENDRDAMKGYYWENVCSKLIKWDKSKNIPLLTILLSSMVKNYHLSYDSDITKVANEIVRSDPNSAWNIIKKLLTDVSPNTRHSLCNWLRNNFGTFDEREPNGPIAYLPIPNIIQWIEEDPEHRAILIANATLGSFDEEHGGSLTRNLLHKYGKYKGVQSAIHSSFNSGGWSGPASDHYKRIREKFRRWLAMEFEMEVVQFIEDEIAYLDRIIEEEEIREEREVFE